MKETYVAVLKNSIRIFLGDRTLQIDIRDDEETEIPTTSTPQQQGVGKSPSRRQSLAVFTATSGSSKKTKVYVHFLQKRHSCLKRFLMVRERHGILHS